MGLFALFLCVASVVSVVAATSTDRADVYRRFSNSINEDNAQSIDHFRLLFDDNAVLIIHRGDASPDDEASGLDEFVKCCVWFRKGSAAKSVITSYTESGAVAFITGVHRFTPPQPSSSVSLVPVEYAWCARADWVGNRIVRYELFADFSHLEAKLGGPQHAARPANTE